MTTDSYRLEDNPRPGDEARLAVGVVASIAVLGLLTYLTAPINGYYAEHLLQVTSIISLIFAIFIFIAMPKDLEMLARGLFILIPPLIYGIVGMSTAYPTGSLLTVEGNVSVGTIDSITMVSDGSTATHIGNKRYNINGTFEVNDVLKITHHKYINSEKVKNIVFCKGQLCANGNEI